jgi:hypothetical protein
MSDIRARAFAKKNRALVPLDIMSDELLDGIKEGDRVLVTIRRPRSIKNHRLLFALLRKVTENSDRWANEEVLLEDLKLNTGLYTIRTSAFSGMPYPVPSSISFAAMPQAEFSAWFAKAVSKLADVLGVTEAELLSEVEDMTGERA